MKLRIIYPPMLKNIDVMIGMIQYMALKLLVQPKMMTLGERKHQNPWLGASFLGDVSITLQGT